MTAGGLGHSPLFQDGAVPVAEVSAQFMAAARHLPRLFDITDDMLRLMSDMEKAYEQTPPDECALARITAEFENNEALVIAKFENYLALDAKLTMFEEAFKARAAELRELGAIAERNRTRLRARLMVAMKTMNRDKVVTPSGIVGIQLNPPAVTVLDATLVPHEFYRERITIDIDKRQILDAFKRTGEIPAGVDITRGERLDVR